MGEIFGILALIVLIISFLMKDERDIRIINSCSAILFIVCGLFKQSTNLIILNSFILIINIVYILKKGEI